MLRPLSVGSSKYGDLGYKARDLPRWKIDHRQHQAVLQLADGIQVGDLRAGPVYPQLAKVDPQFVRRVAGPRELIDPDHPPHPDIDVQERFDGSAVRHLSPPVVGQIGVDLATERIWVFS
jgi:hypothetical protein